MKRNLPIVIVCVVVFALIVLTALASSGVIPTPSFMSGTQATRKPPSNPKPATSKRPETTALPSLGPAVSGLEGSGPEGSLPGPGEEIRHDFPEVTELPDTGFGGFEIVQSETKMFSSMDVREGWLAELSGGADLRVHIGVLHFEGAEEDYRYIDIQGAHGSVRYLQNDAVQMDGYTITQFWSATQQDGTSIVENLSGVIQYAVLFELPDGTCYLTGYIEGDGTEFNTLPLPKSNCFVRKG